MRHARIVCIADTHEMHWQVDVPDGDILIHAGDMLLTGRRFSQKACLEKLQDFNEWLGTLPHRLKVVVAGNHDAVAPVIKKDEMKSLLSNATYLQNDVIEWNGMRIFGSPVSWGHSPNSAFQIQVSDSSTVGRTLPKSQVNKGLRFPKEFVDIAVTHSPATQKGIREYLWPSKGAQGPSPACRVHVGGHLHSSHGVWEEGGVLCLIASLLDDRFKLTQVPIVFDYFYYPRNEGGLEPVDGNSACVEPVLAAGGGTEPAEGAPPRVEAAATASASPPQTEAEILAIATGQLPMGHSHVD